MTTTFEQGDAGSHHHPQNPSVSPSLLTITYHHIPVLTRVAPIHTIATLRSSSLFPPAESSPLGLNLHV